MADHRLVISSRLPLPGHLRAAAWALIAVGFLTLIERSF